MSKFAPPLYLLAKNRKALLTNIYILTLVRSKCVLPECILKKLYPIGLFCTKFARINENIAIQQR